MPRHDRSRTPSERQRAPKGSIVTTVRVPLTGIEEGALAFLRTTWKLNAARTVGKALLDAAQREGWVPTSEAPTPGSE
jgi:hypothetical protein